MVADVAAARGGVDHDHVARSDEAAEHRLVGVGPADGPHLAVVALEDDFQIGLELAFDFIDVGGPPVVALSGMTLGVPMGEVRAPPRPGAAAHDVFAGDEVEALPPPLILLLDQFFDFRNLLGVHVGEIPF